MKSAVAKSLPWLFLGVGILYLVSGLRPARDAEFDLEAFGRLPVVDLGRVKPLDTLARTSLMIISNKQTLYMDDSGATSDKDFRGDARKSPAIRWMLDVMAKPKQARQYDVVRIDHPEIIGLLELDPERKYFSIEDLFERGDTINRQIAAVQSVQANDRSAFQRQIQRLSQQISQYVYLEDPTSLLMVPPATGSSEWVSLTSHLQGEGGISDPVSVEFVRALRAWQNDSPDEFNTAVSKGLEYVDAAVAGRTINRLHVETFYYRFSPFTRTMALYVMAFLLTAVSWLRLSRPWGRAALWVLVLGCVVHTLALVARIYIQGRPPVTNLYSSAVFVGWGAILLGAVLERMYRNGVGTAVAAVMGFATLLVAHHLALDGDTMTTLQAVLDTNFWLATHVVVITLGYASTFLAGFLGIVYIIRGVFFKNFGSVEKKNLATMIYGIICFATLFSFVGTILGGIWADQSWGRFWGWDPKENGAILIVLWNALILHSRWGGLVRERGIALLAVGGNIVTSWSWFGTNMLGVGLHAYGFIDSAVFWMLIFVSSQLLLIAIGSLPPERWRSFQSKKIPGAQRPRREKTARRREPVPSSTP